ncbi:hypothetical protein [Caulobacter sp. 602-1]|uniref:hypothetical protein n=1 Tax=Caulobacter sp. 602-1 TaxID=2492472 RepID=UPI000F630FD7|nr:hypothetical protein [Caulobacter sp. 602-1]RRN66455.1 hypothetical protein EIK80_04005 [Caulobacter sp. 602-1]
MGSQHKVWAVVAAMGVLAASGARAENAKGEATLAKMLEGRTVLAGVNCLETRKIITTQIINGTAIVYRLRGSPTLYVNRPTAGLDDLNSNNALLVGDTPSLCEGNNLFVGDNGGRGAAAGYTGGVRLGEFIPWAKN